MLLVNIFQGNSTEASEEKGVQRTFKAPSGTAGLVVDGSPTPVTESPTTAVLPFLDVDITTGPTGGNFGPYATTTGLNLYFPTAAFQVLVPPL